MKQTDVFSGFYADKLPPIKLSRDNVYAHFIYGVHGKCDKKCRSGEAGIVQVVKT